MDDCDVKPPLSMAMLHAVRERKMRLIREHSIHDSEYALRLENVIIKRETQAAIQEEITDDNAPLAEPAIKQKQMEDMALHSLPVSTNAMRARLILGLDEVIESPVDLTIPRANAATEAAPARLSKTQRRSKRKRLAKDTSLLEHRVKVELEGAENTMPSRELAKAMLDTRTTLTRSMVEALGRHAKRGQLAEDAAAAAQINETTREPGSERRLNKRRNADQKLQIIQNQAKKCETDQVEMRRNNMISKPAMTVMSNRAAEHDVDMIITHLAGPVPVAMEQLRKELQQSVLHDIKTSIVEPTILEYFRTVKLYKTGKVMGRKEAPSTPVMTRNYVAPVAQMLPSTDWQPNPLQEISLNTFFANVKSGVLTEAEVPSSFAVAIRTSDCQVCPHASIRDDAYHTILKALTAAHSLDRDPKTLSNSQGRRVKGRWTCLFKKVRTEPCNWPTEGEAGQYACQWCTNYRRPCIVFIEGMILVLPLAPTLRINRSPNEKEFCVLSDEAEAPKAVLFK